VVPHWTIESTMKSFTTLLVFVVMISLSQGQPVPVNIPYVTSRPELKSPGLCGTGSRITYLAEPTGASTPRINRSDPYAQSAEKTTNSGVVIKSKGKAFFLSMLLPGLGERYAGRPHRAQFFLGTEIALWLSYAGFLNYREWRSDDYHSYAAAHGAVVLSGKTDSYFVDIGNYDSIDDYNAAKLRQRNLPAYYRDVEKYYWKWQTPAERKKFEQLRLSADRADNRAMFVLGAIVANHLVSAIDAIWSTHSFNKAHRTGVGFEFNLGCTPAQVLMTVSAEF
jgi:hypothetical protein